VSRFERTGHRSLTYSAWHRTLPDDWPYIDIDACEYCAQCLTPLLLLEVTYDTGRWKPARVLGALAARARVPALVLYYQAQAGRITGFRLRRIWPPGAPQERVLTVAAFVAGLRQLRRRHQCPAPGREGLAS
jgi:hypothetical protein